MKKKMQEEYEEKLLTNPDFDYKSTFVIYEKEELIAFAIGYLRKKYIDNPEVAGIVNAIIVKKEYRKQGIGSSLLKKLEEKYQGRNGYLSYEARMACGVGLCHGCVKGEKHYCVCTDGPVFSIDELKW